MWIPDRSSGSTLILRPSTRSMARKRSCSSADTSEIASRMCYSERTVKNVLHDLTSRLQLKNRTHAVAYAVREGLI